LDESFPNRAIGADPRESGYTERARGEFNPIPHIGLTPMQPQDRKSINWRAWITGILVALVVIVCLQNSQKVSVEVLFASFNAPLIIVLAIFALLGAFIGYIAPVVRRHRREEKRHNKEIEVKK
jgi:uncharacterized integral membrane protein